MCFLTNHTFEIAVHFWGQVKMHYRYVEDQLVQLSAFWCCNIR
jgi:hypothetical protein